MIRLGSLAGYAFEGPRVLAGWTPPARAGVYAILYKPEPDTKTDKYAVIYVGHADDLPPSASRSAIRGHRVGYDAPATGSSCTSASSRCPGGLRSHRELITHELMSVYRPGCNSDQYDPAWKDEWIGEYSAPTAGPLTTDRDP
jgi:hypothetical protein